MESFSIKMAPAELERYAELTGRLQEEWHGDFQLCPAHKDTLSCVYCSLREGVPNVEQGANSLEESKYSTPTMEHGFC